MRIVVGRGNNRKTFDGIRGCRVIGPNGAMIQGLSKTQLIVCEQQAEDVKTFLGRGALNRNAQQATKRKRYEQRAR